ncbi:MAG: hypothetical protein C6H99_07330 [Epsilonproteobacteria bacterium]|nr:hypothetical protein [Campylobacterota bacterium]NPA63542.1 hypothetical protein [Campylobacterota bacterium]
MKELFEIIPKLPAVRVFEFAKDYETSKQLSEFCKAKGHYLEIVAFEDEIYEQIKDLGSKSRRIAQEKERYNQRSMMFDTIFVSYPLQKVLDLEALLRKIYRMTKNAGDIVLYTTPQEQEALERLLEELNYVAINPIELQDVVALTAKKLHGWAKV